MVKINFKNIDILKKLSDIQYYNFYHSLAFKEVNKICEPIIKSFAFQRLENSTFLGILSPKFNIKFISNFLNRKLDISSPRILDHTRKEHSLGVAFISYNIANYLKFKKINICYATIWGLLHDISSWPLSHTGEVAFSNITKISSSKLRYMIVSSSPDLPERYHMHKAFKEIGISPDTLHELFYKKECLLNDPELKIFWEIIHSQITPDTIEGIWRACLALGIKNIPRPHLFFQCFSINLVNEININLGCLENIKDFWKIKSKLYDEYINYPPIVLLESNASLILKERFHNLTLVESLEIKEDILIKQIKEGIEKLYFDEENLFRYKEPLSYKLDSKKFNNLKKKPFLNVLNQVLQKKEKRRI